MQESLVVLGFMVTLHCNDPVQAPISVFYLIFIHVSFEFTFVKILHMIVCVALGHSTSQDDYLYRHYRFVNCAFMLVYH